MSEKLALQVLERYNQLKSQGKLASNLNNPTPGNIRDESLLLKENKPDELNVLRHFTDPKNPTRLDIDKFRPVVKYLTGTVPNPNIRVVELVAWLIRTDDEIIVDPTSKPKQIKKLNFIQRTGIVATLGLIMGVTYWKGVPPDGCMYWTGTEYKAVDCDAQIPNTQILALNQQKLDHFKKITLPDTMTFNSLNKVWYSKINNEVEFFTTKGKHPLKTDRILKPITIHILGKYGNNRALSLIKTNEADTTEKD